MSLLFDQNLSFQLCYRLSDLFPACSQVAALGLERERDDEVWAHARSHGLAIVTKDSDFHHMSFLYGAPPKVIWLRLGNCTTEMVEALIRRDRDVITAFLSDREAALLNLDRG